MELPEGKPLSLEEAALFIKSVKDRRSFNGLVEMQGRTPDKKYRIELLMSEGEVIAAEVVGTMGDIPIRGEKALDEIKKLGGSEGDLKLVRFQDGEMDRIIEKNISTMLEKRVMLENFKMKIKPIALKQETEKTSMLGAVKGLFNARPAPLKGEFRGQFRLEAAEARTEEQDLKKGLITRIKSRRFGRLTEKLLAKRKVEEEKKPPMTEGKVETRIDKLFNLLDKRYKLRINDSLARELGVSKERIEEWAVILEEHNLVAINYPAIGEPEITKKKKK